MLQQSAMKKAEAGSNNSPRSRCLPALALCLACGLVYMFREGTTLPTTTYQSQTAAVVPVLESYLDGGARTGALPEQQPKLARVLPPLPYEALRRYNRSCSSSREAAEDQLLLFDLQGRRLEAKTGLAGNATVVAWGGDDDGQPAYLLILSRDGEGAVVCQGGPMYVVQVRSERVRLRPRVQDVGDGLHVVAMDLQHFFTPDTAGPGRHVDVQVLVQLRWPQTDFARDDGVVYQHRLQRPSTAPIWGLVLRVPWVEHPGAGETKEKRWCEAQDFGQWDDEEEGRWGGRWVQQQDGGRDGDDDGGGEEEWRRRVRGLHSDGWVFEREDCRLRLFSPDEAWRALDGRWVVMFGVSTMQDFIRNLVVDVLNTTLTGREEKLCVVRRYGDMVVSRYPAGQQQQQFRLTWFWIGDWPEVYDW